MKTNKQTHLAALAVLIACVLQTTFASAQDDASETASFATEDLIGIAYADLNEVQFGDLMERAIESKLLEGVKAEQASMGATMAQSFVEQLTSAGAKRIYCLVRQADIENLQAPVVAFSLKKDASLEKLERRVKMLASLMGDEEIQVTTKGDLVIVGQQAAVKLFSDSPTVPREDFASAWKQSDTSNAGIILCGDADSRRVIRELFPQLEKPFQQIDGKLIADRVEHVSLSLTLKGQLAGKLAVQTADAEAANIMARSYKSLVEQMNETESETLQRFNPRLESWAKVMAPILRKVESKIEGSNVVFDLEPVLQDPKAIATAIEPVRRSARIAQTTNNVRQILLAMLNFESAYKHLPARAITDKDGKPLLSWRVQILPFLEQNNLYKQFKLDEPWDSPHNIKLLETMPITYASQFPEDDELQAAGKTRIVLPVGEGCAFDLAEGKTFRQIKDGSSNTIAVLLSTPEAAVPWTKPADWEIDMANPTATIIQGDSPRIFGVLDGSVHEFSESITDEVFKAMLTFEGGEVFDWGSVEKE
ncbi:DUF1559 family PulG-like putative transporter [Mariniblastus fucicola]|uniref:DUF1559 domain-containing protein n=1 Tax=Mariniblastus fucicola TaxID=980251 RepID=A0A5B9PK85_9BACT|nr:DUF1559 domain-containing protein [Mariniblastus fucicola]QEG25096.1 hypothetical protein MFFC18_50190 [Mariniblastus fucicola]